MGMEHPGATYGTVSVYGTAVVIDLAYIPAYLIIRSSSRTLVTINVLDAVYWCDDPLVAAGRGVPPEADKAITPPRPPQPPEL